MYFFWFILVNQNNLGKDSIINMDETPCFFDMVGGATFTMRGSKDVLQKSSGHDKMRYVSTLLQYSSIKMSTILLMNVTSFSRYRFTAVLTVTASGRKLPTMLIFKNLVNIPQLQKDQSWPKG